jgi:phospho-N-acetylmuramoyl-pentapeptide-transferase
MAAAGVALSSIVIPFIIRIQKKASVGQQIYESGPASHLAKQGTPTMGGLSFVAAAIGSMALATDQVLVIGVTVVMAGAIGFADDLIIMRKRTALGLRARWKLVLLVCVAAVVILGAYIQFIGNCQVGAYFAQRQWWFGSIVTLPNVWFCLLSVLAVVGCANAVNLTDGIDGLAATTMLPPLILLTYLTGSGIAAAVTGALIVFLIYNRKPAKIFMGDTGSLALGALLAALAIYQHLMLILPFLGIVFVVEALSVIAQVVSFKLTGNRILKMSPLHHHFELSGWSEQRITGTFGLVSLLATLSVWAVILRIPPH